MDHNNLFWSRQLGSECKACAPAPACTCNTDTEECIRVDRDCYNCATFRCEVKGSSTITPSSSKGASKGALAGAIVGILIFLALAIGGFLWYRRRQKAEKAAQEPVVKEVPASAADVLQRPDPSEKMQTPQSPTSNVRVYSSHSNTTIDLDPESNNGSVQHTQGSQRNSNPFTDTHSIQTAVTEGTNVIPIALVQPDNSTISAPPGSPSRPPRSPDLNLEHANVSMDTLRTPDRHYADSQISGISGMSRRQSYQTNASFSSDFLYEAPMIVTGTSAVRQVLGVSKAEVITAPGSSPPGPDTLRVPSMTRSTTTSPLAASSFGPADVVKESDEEEQEIIIRNDPFGDEHSSPLPSSQFAPPTTANTTATFGTSINHASRPVTQTVEWQDNTPFQPWVRSDDSSRPSSINTQAGSVIDIGSATRVNVGLANRIAVSEDGSNPRSPVRATMGKLVTPSTAGHATFEGQQQQVSFINAHAFENDGGKRSSAASGVSVTADSILESFPFVPPSPISNRPARSPPASPLAREAFQAQPPSPLDPPNTHQVFGASGSHLSTASSGLGSFDFQIDPEPVSTVKTQSSAPSAFKKGGNQGNHRASLDTLALTADLSSYPLGFEHDPLPPKRA